MRKKVKGKSSKGKARKTAPRNTGSPRRKKKGRKGSAKQQVWRRRLLRLALLLLGLCIGIGTPWVVWLDKQIRTEFEGRKWDVPSRVYARPLSLYSGMPLSRQALQIELRAAGYKRAATAGMPGSYAVDGNHFEIYRRAFAFDDGSEPAKRFTVSLAGGHVASVGGAAAGKAGLIRLDPAEIASIYPLHEEDRTLVSLDRVPALLVTGLQAVEDRQFKHHHGVSLRSIARAALANIRAGRTVQGGSTLTQQLVKNYFLTSDRTLLRKINEAIMAVLLEIHYDKRQILEAYINEVFLGQQGKHAIHGFARASEFYFDRPLKSLDAGRIALLVGMVRGASLYNPRRHAGRAKERRDQVLDIFVKTGLMTAAAADAAKARPLGVTARPRSGRSLYPAFLDLVRRQLRQDYLASDLANDGLRIFTTLSPSEQELAAKAVADGLNELRQRGLPADLQAALVLADISSGEVRAVVGDRVPGRRGFNRALDARRQVGSVIKPLIYLLALEHSGDYNLLTPVSDEPVSLRQADGSDWSPANYDHKSHGVMPLMDALVHSYNQATVRVGLRIGVANLVNEIKQLGVKEDVPALPSTLLGAVELTPIEVTQMYQSLAAGGYSVPLRSVTAVMLPRGEKVRRYPLRLLPLERRDAIALVNYALTQVVERGTARQLHGLLGSSITVAGKTGTTNEQRDSWFVGYTRDRLAVSWVGRDDDRPAGVTGSNAAMRLWANLFRHLPYSAVDMGLPDGVNYVWVNASENARTGSGCPQAVQIPFIAGTEPEAETNCFKRQAGRKKKSIWEKWFKHD
ncbi:MAG: penicillin-binding protein 1B [Lysobacterales bacterium]|jgi:penicillin-binding protein 1B